VAEKTIVITGVSRGLGRALLDWFVAAGHQVIGCSRSSKAAQRLAEQYPAPHRFTAVDVSEVNQVEDWADEILAEYDPPDLLINNAALINGNAPLWEIQSEEWMRLVEVNINGVYYMIRAFLPAMIRRGSGVVVNMSSGWGRSVSPDVVPYCTTKWAIEGMTRGLAEELPPGLAAVALSPGVIHTEMLESCMGDAAGSYPRPHDWAKRAAPFLLDLGPEHNGKSLTVPSE
jgi:NAD(P)-dependent dehydrogenase (short-subunit alcohol dehydrogenase family)